MQVTVRQLGSVTIVDLEGRLVYGEQCDFLRQRVKEELANGNKQLIINLEGVPTVDSGGIGTLVAVYTSARSLGGSVKLAGANSKVHHSLDLTHITSVVQHYKDVNAGIAAFEDSSPATA